jgi:hypothetical protein
MHLRAGTREQRDPEGRVFSSLMELRNAALFRARDLLTTEVCEGAVFDLGSRIDVEDETGTVVHTLAFKHALTFIAETNHRSFLNGGSTG